MNLLAEALNQFMDNLNNRTPIPSSFSGTKAYFPDTFSSTDLDKLKQLFILVLFLLLCQSSIIYI